MKKALHLIVTYFVFLILSIIFGTFLYMIFHNALNFIAGDRIIFFQLKVFLPAFLYISFGACFFICPFISIYRVRHLHGILQTAAYILICLITWIVIFPSVYYIEKKAQRFYQSEKQEKLLSKNYFRETEDKIYFITKNFSPVLNDEGKIEYETNSVIMDKTENGIVTYEKISDSEPNGPKAKAKPFNEIGIKNAFKFEKIFSLLGIGVLVDVAKKSLEGGIWTYLQFLTLAFLLCSLYGISHFFDWRILNTYAIFVTTICIIFVNITYYMPIFEPFRVKINDFGFLEILSRHIEEPLLFTANTFFGIIFIAAGCIKYILHKVKKQKA